MTASNKLIKYLISIILTALVSAACMLLFAQTAYAEGTYTVSGSFDPKDSAGQSVDVGETTYKLYYVADFDDDNTAVFRFLEHYRNVGAGLNFRKADFDEEGKSDEDAVRWKEAWMSSAQTLSDYVRESDIVGTYTSDDGRFSFTGLANGLYLLTGTSSEVTGADGNTTYWWPRPMYVRVLNSNTEVSMKAASEETDRYTVYKTWENMPEDMESLIRPASIDVRIFYGGTDDEHLKETVTLDESNSWTYSWKAGRGETDPSNWHVQEVMTEEMAESFTVSHIENHSEETRTTVINIKNTYETADLEIVKILRDYVSQGDTRQTVVFRVTAYSGDKTVFSKFAGISYGEDSDASAKVLVTGISRSVDRIVVREAYAGNYTPDVVEKEAVFEGTDDGKGVWKVSFTNTLQDKPDSFDSGVINKYSITGDGQFSFSRRVGSGVGQQEENR